ncbi:hypothetical protein Tco_0236513 [Tanacetum coccineum]
MSESDGTLNDAIPRLKEVVSPSLVDDTMAKEKLSPVVTTTESYPPLPTQVATLAGNAPGKSSYANVTGKPSEKKLNFRTLFTPGGNGIDVVVPVESIRTISERFANTAYDVLDAMLENGPWFIRNNPLILRKWHPHENLLKEDVSTPLMLDSYTADMCMQSWGTSSYARAMIELRVDVELKDNIVATMPKITREGYYTCNIRVDATKNLKKTSRTPKGILVRQKMGFKPKQVYLPVSKTSTANTCGIKMNNSESTKEVSKSNPFEVLTSIDNDVVLGTNGGISNSADKGTINFSSSNTSIGEKIDKIERQICEGKVRFVDDDGNPLVPTDSYPDDDDYDPYDDDMYENHDMSDHLQSICDDLDITVRGRKKK